jgi:hypothetical protein
MMISPITIIWFSLAVIVIALIVKAVTAVVSGTKWKTPMQESPTTPQVFPYIYRWNRMCRKGQPCAVLVRGKMNSCLVMFEEGFTAVTSRNALRRRKLEGDHGD